MNQNLISHIKLCQANIDLYAAPTPLQIEGVVYSIQTIGDVWVITLRGSITLMDWWRDFKWIPLRDDQLGYVHSGFFEGMRALFQHLITVIPAGAMIVITGHSLGGARARDLAALFLVNGYKVLQLVTFGSPKPGFANLARIIQKCATTLGADGEPMLGEHCSYRNRNDPIPQEPIDIEAAQMDWQHPEPWISISAAPALTDLEPLRDHHIGLYLQGVTAYLGSIQAPAAILAQQ
jgi:pimeloyl-ACP methyl ester carboxylesterase